MQTGRHTAMHTLTLKRVLGFTIVILLLLAL
ncbi:hypothetical protein LTSEGIV_2370, partial [Salmonella enterica subsp. enterica serovar Give str. S5-487]